jgi:hypothetical protein
VKKDLRAPARLFDHHLLIAITIDMMREPSLDKLCDKFALVQIDENPHAIVVSKG